MMKRGKQAAGEIKEEFAPDFQVSPDGVLHARKWLRYFEKENDKYDTVRAPLFLMKMIFIGFAVAVQVDDASGMVFFSYRNEFEKKGDNCDNTILVFVSQENVWKDLAAFFKGLDAGMLKQFRHIHIQAEINRRIRLAQSRRRH